MSESNSSGNGGTSQGDAQLEPRVVDGRQRDFFIVDNAVVDEKIEMIDETRRPDAGWIYTVLCRKSENTNGRTTVPLRYLMKKSGRSKPIVIDALKQLHKVELIHIRTRKVDGKQVPSEYVLLKVHRVNRIDPVDEPGKNNDENRVNRIYRNTEDSTLENSSSAQGARAREAAEERAEELTDGLAHSVKAKLSIRMTKKQREKITQEYVEILLEDEATDDELEAVIDHIVARLPSFDRGLSAFGPEEALSDVRTRRARSRADEAPKVSGPAAAARRTAGYEEFFGHDVDEEGEEAQRKPRDKPKRITRADTTVSEHNQRVEMLEWRYLDELDGAEEIFSEEERVQRAKTAFDFAANSLRGARWIDPEYAEQVVEDALARLRETLEFRAAQAEGAEQTTAEE